MTSDPNRPEVLLSVANEIEAAAIVSALAEYDIEAIATGGYTSGFIAGAPGSVAISVKQADLKRAKEAMVNIRYEEDEVDWSKVDVMEGVESEPTSDQVATIESPLRPITDHLWWIIELLAVVLCFVIWLFTHNAEALIYAIAALALVGLILALSRHARH